MCILIFSFSLRVFSIGWLRTNWRNLRFTHSISNRLLRGIKSKCSFSLCFEDSVCSLNLLQSLYCTCSLVFYYSSTIGSHSYFKQRREYFTLPLPKYFQVPPMLVTGGYMTMSRFQISLNDWIFLTKTKHNLNY